MIEIEGLTKRFGNVLAVDDVSFHVNPGEVVGFLGHNGAGKTTTLRMLLGQLRPTAGESRVLGTPFVELQSPLRRVGVLLGSGLHPGRTGRNHLRVSAAVGGLRTDRIDFLLEMVGLADAADRRAGGYSQGMRQRLGIATALLADPEVIVLDEPINGLDPRGIRWLRTLLRALADDGRTVLLSSHQLAEVAQTVDRVVVIDRGAIAAESTLQELMRQAGTEVRVRSPGAEVLADELHRAGIATAGVTAEELRARDVPPRVVSELARAAAIPVWEVRAEEPSLEEAFFELTGGPDESGSTAPDKSEDDADRAGEESEQADGSGDAGAEDDAADEDALDRDLGALRAGTYAGVVAVLGSEPGVGRTTLSFLLGDVLATHTEARVLVLGLSLDRERLATPIPVDRRSALSATELLDDVEGFDAAARISPYVSVAHSGLSTVKGPRRAAPLEDLTAQRIEALLAFARRFFEVVILDVGDLPETPLHEVVRRVDEVVLISSARADAAEQAVSPVLKVIEAERSERATLLLNRVDPERARSFGEQRGAGVHGLVPDDRELIRKLDLGDFRVEHVEPATRIALKRAALTVAEGLQ